MDTLKSTPLLDEHLALGARMVPFSGWNMPVQYRGILAEHEHTRSAVSLFDCSHMGQFRLRGDRVAEALDGLLPRRVTTQKVGSCRYNFLLTDRGTVVDDVVVYRMAEDEVMMVVNAGTIDGDAAHLRGLLPAAVQFADESAEIAKLDVQGPGAGAAMAAAGADAAALPRYFRWADMEVAGVACLVSRTGYTGELGYEIYAPSAEAPAIWRRLLDVPEVEAAGLGARDTLRLEVGYPLYGHELDTETTPVEAGFGALVDLGHAFVGRDALTRRTAGKKLVGIRFDGRRAPRHGATVTVAGECVGVVTSGSFAPSLQQAVALAYVAPEAAVVGQAVHGAVSRGDVAGEIVELPFYTEGTCRN